MRRNNLITNALFVAIFASAGTDAAFCDDKTATLSEPVVTKSFVYKSKPRRTLTVYFPDDGKASDKRSALVIFRCNIPAQREHFRRLGMVIIKPQLAPVNSGQLPQLSLD